MPMLAEAASRAAVRHDWAWRERGARWDLFKPQMGPAKVARDFVPRDADGISHLMRETGLGANLAASGFGQERSEEHTSELQSLMRISYAVCCLNKQIQHTVTQQTKTRKS